MVHLRELLGSINFSDCLFEQLEVIVVNDGSSDGTADFLFKFSKMDHLFSFKYFNLNNQGPAFARNYGAQMSSGNWLVFIDDDCLLSINYFSSADKILLNQPDLVSLAGHVVSYSNSFISRYIDWSGLMLSPYVDNHNKTYFVTANAWIRKDVFLQLGGFDLSFKNASGEDVYLSMQIRSAGYSIYFDKNVFVRHRHRDSLIGLIKTCSLYGRGHRQIDILSSSFSEYGYIRNLISAASESITKIWRSKTYYNGFPFFFLDLVRSISWTYGYRNAITNTPKHFNS